MAIVDLASTLHGKYGDGARYMFEFLCGALILEESLGKEAGIFDLPKGGQVFSIAVNHGDGGLDIIHQKGDEWIVFQCKFLFRTTLGKSDYKESFHTSLKTAKDHGKKIKRWVLCIPKDLSTPELKGWEKFKEAQEKLVSQMEIIPQNMLISALNKNIHIMNLYVTASVSSITMSSQRKKPDIIILEDVIDQIETKKIIDVLKLATGYNSTGYVYISKNSLQDFQNFEATLTKMRSDFDDYEAFDVYNELRQACKEFLDYFSWAYKPLSNNRDDNLYLGYDVNPLFKTKFADGYIYRDRLKWATTLYDMFEKNFKKLDSYYKGIVLPSN